MLQSEKSKYLEKHLIVKSDKDLTNVLTSYFSITLMGQVVEYIKNDKKLS